uniref:Uncharacterized protein n=1 Tax=viral metagenome TaxID=1070528 RepID=A0A6M3JGR5_9ZZZZ
MTKEELLTRIERLERRIAELEREVRKERWHETPTKLADADALSRDVGGRTIWPKR